jgi:hypothetical protein
MDQATPVIAVALLALSRYAKIKCNINVTDNIDLVNLAKQTEIANLAGPRRIPTDKRLNHASVALATANVNWRPNRIRPKHDVALGRARDRRDVGVPSEPIRIYQKVDPDRRRRPARR